jgi:ferric-dicitrate binding protein FerR (iron transport regulator)
MRYAAIIAVVMGLTWAATLLLQPEQADVQPLAFQQITVPYGQQTQIVLSDGSKVWLNAGTTLQYPSDFGVRNRMVILNGEASFEVAASEVPFTVTAAHVEISVLGTRFNVRCYQEDDLVETALFEGSVRMKIPGKEFVMHPGELAICHKEQQTAEVKQMQDIDYRQAWVNRHLIIDRKRLADIAIELERRYDVQIDITDEGLKDCRYTGKFVYNEDIKQVLKIISHTTPIRYKMEGKKITVSRK